ncbi:X2-like carbohydrate binding domain-containing protein [Cohnella yongneupensis]|uniref:Alpha-galactosidase n=1 Tax=Cohnella yongneupensis TaxID=425006 RepID=A0ABW0R0N4_9BACL
MMFSGTETSIKRLIMMGLAFILIVASLTSVGFQPTKAEAADNGPGAKPFMGWSSYSMQVWEGYNGGDGWNWINEAEIKAQSDAMKALLQSHGYNYINVDSGWSGGIDEYGRPVPSATLYPGGFTNLINYVHANGQKFGIYWGPGISPAAYNADLPIYGAPGCSTQDIVVLPLKSADYWNYSYKIDFSNPCAQSYINSIADQFAAWGVDFLKLDSVTPGSGIYDLSKDSRDDVKAWSQALAPHNIWFELSWALDIKYADTWKQYANGWRVHWDIECYCNTLTRWDNIARLFPTAAQWWRHAGPEGWNDFDSLNIGNGAMDGLTQVERQTAMTFFAASAVPLYIGNDLTKLDDYGVQLLTNDEVIAVDQAGRPARPVSTDTNQQVWYANNGDGTYSVALFNLGSTAAEVKVNWSDIGISGPASVRDLWNHSELGIYENGFSAAAVPPHGSRLLKVTVQKGTAFANDDDVGIRYSGSWVRNEGKEWAGASQSLLVNVIDSNAKNSSISPVSASFDKNAAAQADVATTMTLNRNTLQSIANGGTLLTAGTDYTVSGNTVTIKKEYLAGRPVGNVSLTFDFSEGKAQTFSITIIDSTIRNSVVLPAVIDFDKGDETQDDQTTTFARNGNELTAISRGGIALSEGTAYTVSGNTVAFKKEYLATLPAGTSELTFSFTGGAPQTVTLVILDSSIGGSLSLNDDNPAIVYTGTWHPNTGRGLGDYQDDIHWTETAGDSFEYTFTGTGIELITELDGSQGIIDVYVDGEFKQTVNTNNTYRSTHHTVYYVSGMPAGNHTLKVVKRAWENSGGFFMLLDQLRVALPDLLNPIALGFDRSAPSPDDVRSTISDGYQISGVANGGIPLAAGIDYSVTGNELTVKQAYLAGLPVGTTNLVVTFVGGATQRLAIVVTDSAANNSTISPVSVDFDKNAAAQADVSTVLSLEGNQLTSIVYGGTALSEGTDYTVSGNVITINKSYLAARPTGTTRLRFIFNAGESRILSIAIRDTTPLNSSIVPTVLSFDKTAAASSDVTTTMTLNDNDLVGITNGVTPLNPGEDYTVSGNVVAISKEYLGTLSPGTVNLSLQFSAGASRTLTVVVSESLRGRYIDLNDDDASIVYNGAWNPNTNRGLGDYKDDIHWSETNGNSFEYTFKGTGIELITELDSSQGKMDIYIDGEFRQTVDTYNTSRVTHRAVYNVAGLPDGEHTIKAVKISGQFMLLDQLRVRIADIIGPDKATFDKSSKGQDGITTELGFDRRNLIGVRNGEAALKQGKDYTVSGNSVTIKKQYLEKQQVGTVLLTFDRRGDYQNDVHSTTNNGDYFEYSFKGTGVEIIAPTDPSQGEIDVFVDNEFKGTVSLQSDSRLSRQTVFSIFNLTSGTHTIKGVKKSGAAFMLDGVRFRVPKVVH